MRNNWPAIVLAAVSISMLTNVAQAKERINASARGEFESTVETCLETVQLNNRYQLNLHATQDGAGGEHLRITILTVGEGLGELSGVMYRWNSTFTEGIQRTSGGREILRRRDRIDLIGQGLTDNLFVSLVVEILITPDGEAVVQRFEVEGECRG